jgi:hypothetical protein
MTSNLIKLLNESNYAFYFLAVDEFLDIKLYPTLKNFHLIYAYKNPGLVELKKIGSPYFCLEEQGIVIEKNSGKLISHIDIIDYISKTSAHLKLKPVIIPFKPSAKIDFICKKQNWINACNPSDYNRLLEDKIKFPQICKKYNIPTVPNYIDTLNSQNFKKYQDIFKQQKLVIQTHFGWAGKSTFQASSWSAIKNKIAINSVVKFSPYLNGYSLLNNCCLTKHGLIQSPPALQYTGIKPFTQNPYTTVGRQWPSFAPLNIQEKIKEITNNFSEVLKDLNYKGFFGLDFLINNNQVYLLECNPRLTASFAFYTSIENKNKLTPLFYFHLIEFLKLNYEMDLQQEQQRFYNQNIIGSELTQKNKNNNTIKKYNDFSVFSNSKNPIRFKPQILDLFH